MSVGAGVMSQVASAPEVVSAAVAVTVAVAGLVAAMLRRLQTRIDRGLTDLRVHTTVAADEARGAREGVTNSHGTHLRDDVDALSEAVRQVLALLEQVQAQVQDRDARTEAEARQAAEQLARLQGHIEGVRGDFRTLVVDSTREHDDLRRHQRTMRRNVSDLRRVVRDLSRRSP